MEAGLCGLQGTDAVDFLTVLSVGEFEIVMELEAQEETRRHTEEAGKPEIVDRGDAAFAVLHFRDVAGDDAAGGSEIFLAEGRVLNDFGECFGEGVEERDGLFRFHGSVVVGDFHVVGISVFPTEGDAPLFVNSDGVESFEFPVRFPVRASRLLLVGWVRCWSSVARWMVVSLTLARAWISLWRLRENWPSKTWAVALSEKLSITGTRYRIRYFVARYKYQLGYFCSV